MSGFAPGCHACGALPAHPCRRPRQACPRMPPQLDTATPADLERIAERVGFSCPSRSGGPARPLEVLNSRLVASTAPDSPAFAYACPECESEPYAACRDEQGEYLGHGRIHVGRTRVGAPVDDEGTPVFREHNHTSPAQDIARLAYWLRFWEATGATVPAECKRETVAAVARWPLGGGKS